MIYQEALAIAYLLAVVTALVVGLILTRGGG